MRYIKLSTTLAILLTLLLMGMASPPPEGEICGTLTSADYTVASVRVDGPTTIPSGGDAFYDVVYTIERTPGFTEQVTPFVLLQDEDGFVADDLLGWDVGEIAPEDHGFASFTLICANNGRIVGTSTTTTDRAAPNNANSGERTAEVYGRVIEFCSAVIQVTCE